MSDDRSVGISMLVGYPFAAIRDTVHELKGLRLVVGSLGILLGNIGMPCTSVARVYCESKSVSARKLVNESGTLYNSQAVYSAYTVVRTW
jgi:hypothetical protein